MREPGIGVASRRAALALVALAVAACALPAEPAPLAAAKEQIPRHLRSGIAPFRRRVAAVLAGPEARRASWGVVVADAATGRTLYALNADRYFLPASNAKLFTAALALATLGPDYRFRTTLETSATVDAGGVLHGDLVLVGRGDPDLSNRVFPFVEKEQFEGPPERALAELADQAVGRGIRRISGDVVADTSYFTDGPYPPGWTLDDLVAHYGAAVSAIAVNDNALEIKIVPGAAPGQPASFTVAPWPGPYQFTNEITTVAPGAEPQLSVRRDPGSLAITLSGAVPLRAAQEKVELGMDRPAEYAAALLEHLLVARGVRIDGTARVERAPAPLAAPRTVLAEHLSPPLSQEIRFLLKTSENLHAEMVLRACARVATGVGSTEAGLKLERQFLEKIGIRPEEVRLEDGSGLSRYDLVTPEAVVALLRAAAGESWGAIFRDALPVAGEDGTLAERMKESPARGRIAAKTGSLDHAHALSGYATTLSGDRLIFAIFVNNEAAHGREATGPLDAIAEAIVEIGGGRRKRRRWRHRGGRGRLRRTKS
jgi:D-alanyl-D-alanine carboxypeptidase/D-alanyl-D-alanine-endopeptidase (penicillin-binding protein 4)